MHTILFHVKGFCFAIILSYLDTRFETWCPQKNFYALVFIATVAIACCQNVLLTLEPKKGCKTSTRNPAR